MPLLRIEEEESSVVLSVPPTRCGVTLVHIIKCERQERVMVFISMNNNNLCILKLSNMQWSSHCDEFDSSGASRQY